MSMSTKPTSFPESGEQSSSEHSDELTMALAAGQWRAIMEVAYPISEEPEYGDLTSGLCWGTVEAGDTSRPTSLVFSDASEKALHSDATLKTTEQQRKPEGAQVAAKSSQAAPVSAGSLRETPVPKTLQRAPVPAPKVPSCSSQGAPMPEEVPDRRKLIFPEPLRQQQKSQASFSSQRTLPDNISKRQKQKIPEPLRRELMQLKVLLFREHLCLKRPQSGKKIKILEPLRRELLQQKLQVSVQVALPDNISKRQKLKIPEPLRRELLRQNPQASSFQGTLVPDKTSKRQTLKIPEPLEKEMLQQKSVSCIQGAPVNDKIPGKKKLKIPELLRKELLQPKSQASSVQGAMPAKSPQDTPIPDRTPVGAPVHARTPQEAAVPVGSPKGADIPSSIPKGALVHSGTSQGALVPAGSSQQVESLIIPSSRGKSRESSRKSRGNRISQREHLCLLRPHREYFFHLVP